MIPGQRITMAMVTRIFFEFFPRRIFPLGFLGNPEFGSIAGCQAPSGNDNGRLFYDQIILYGADPFDAPCDFHRFIDGLLRIDEAAQLNGALEGFNPDLE